MIFRILKQNHGPWGGVFPKLPLIYQARKKASDNNELSRDGFSSTSIIIQDINLKYHREEMYSEGKKKKGPQNLALVDRGLVQVLLDQFPA